MTYLVGNEHVILVNVQTLHFTFCERTSRLFNETLYKHQQGGTQIPRDEYTLLF